MKIKALTVLLSFSLLFTACSSPPPGDNTAYLDPSVPLTANNAEELRAGLARYINNTAENPIQVTLNVNDLGGVRGIIEDANKYIFLDLSSSTITEIPRHAFWDCLKLTSIILPDSVESIGSWVFDDTKLTDITIPASVVDIHNEAFANCKLTAINVDENNPVYTSENGILFNKEKTILIRYPEGKPDTSFTVPSGVTSLEHGAFYSCKNLTAVSIPDSVISIGERVFEDCYYLTSVKLSNRIEIIEFQAFARCISLLNITIPNIVTEIKECAFEFCYELTNITIPSSVKIIRQQAFGECYNLSSITFKGTILYDNFSRSAFSGWQFNTDDWDFRDKFYALDSIDGTPGTYTRELPEEWDNTYPWR